MYLLKFLGYHAPSLLAFLQRKDTSRDESVDLNQHEGRSEIGHRWSCAHVLFFLGNNDTSRIFFAGRVGRWGGAAQGRKHC